MASRKRKGSPEPDSAMAPPTTPRVHFADETLECPSAPKKKRTKASDGRQQRSILKPTTETTYVASSGVMQNSGLVAPEPGMKMLMSDNDRSNVHSPLSTFTDPFTWAPYNRVQHESDHPFLVGMLQEVDQELSRKAATLNLATSGPFMASNTPPGGFPNRPLPYSVPSATRAPSQPEDPGRNLPQVTSNPIPLRTQSSDLGILNRLLANPQLAPFHDAARSHAVDRTSQSNFNLNLANFAPRNPPQQSMSLQDRSTQSSSQFLPPVSNAVQANPGFADIYNTVSSHRANRSFQVGFDNNVGSLAASPAPASASPRRPSLGVDPAMITIRVQTGQQNINYHPHSHLISLASPAAEIAPQGSNNHSENEQKRKRGGPRTRYHPSSGHTGIDRTYRSQASQCESPVTVTGQSPPLPEIRANVASPSRVSNAGRNPRSCNECPHFWDTGNPFLSNKDPMADSEDPMHSPPIKPCAKASAHTDAPFYVCAACRVRGAKHRANFFRDLLKQPKVLPLCNECAEYRIEMIAKEEDMEDGKLVRMGCQCVEEWTCFGCTLNDMRLAKMMYETHKDSRRGLTSMFDFEGKRYVNIEDLCICGGRLDGTEHAWQCSSCHGIGIDFEGKRYANIKDFANIEDLCICGGRLDGTERAWQCSSCHGIGMLPT
ncbi:MAG: hypothetical protein Q9218_000114 [Villophora microphyllina]